MEALAQAGFALAEDHMRVWRPALRGSAGARAGGYLGAFARAQLSSRFFAGLARVGLHGLDVARVAVHPGDVTVPELLASIRATYASFASRRRVRRAMRILLRDPFMLHYTSAHKEGTPSGHWRSARFLPRGRDERYRARQGAGRHTDAGKRIHVQRRLRIG
jgi:hypothetical protein